MRRCLPLLGLLLVGCIDQGVSTADAERNEEAFSQAAYEQAMRKAGKTDELEYEKAQAGYRRQEERVDK